MASRIKPEKRKAAGLGDFNFPTAQENREIPVIVGTVRQKAPNSVWHGDLKTVAVKKSVPNPMFFGLVKTKKETGQYRYFVGMALVLGQGQGGVKLKDFQIEDKVVWAGDLAQGTFAFDKSNLFGGEDKEGGYAGTFDYYGGSWVSTFNSYLNSQLLLANSKARNWKGITYLVQRGPSSGQVAPNTFNGYVGLSENIKAFSFTVQRFPDSLGQSQYTIINSDDANPIEWAYEVLTNFDYGANVPPSQIDLNSFRNAAQTVFNEGLGCSELWDTDRDIMDVLNDINEMIDGAIFVDRTTGLWTCKLARADYNSANLFIFDEDNVEEEIDFSTNTGKDAPSEILVSFVDKGQNHKTREAGFKNLAIRRNQSAPHQKKEEFYGVANGVQASRLAFRESRIYASNLRKVTFKSNREGHWVRPMAVFKYRRKDIETGTIQEYIFRCARVDDGEFIDGFIEIEALQDVFSLGTLYYSPPNPTSHVPVNGDAVDSQNKYVSEQPYLFSGSNIRLWGFASQPNGSNRNFDFYLRTSNAASYILGYQNANFAPTGLLTTDFSRGSNIETGNNLIIGSGNNLSQLTDTSAGDIITNGQNLFVFSDTGEICAFESITPNGNGTYTLNNIWRGLLDTTQETHPIGARVWFFTLGQALPDQNLLNSTLYNSKFLTNSLRGSLDLSQTTPIDYMTLGRSYRPLAPANVLINGVLNSQSIPGAGNDIVFNWINRNRLSQTTVLKQSDSEVAPEAGQSVTIKIFSSSNQLLKTYENLTGNSFNYTAAMQTSDLADSQLALKFLIYSSRNGLTSYQSIRLAVARPSGVIPALPDYSLSGNYTPIPSDTATSINGVPIIGTPSVGQTLVFDANGNLVWSTVTGTSIRIREVDNDPTGILSEIQFPNGLLSVVSPGVYRVSSPTGAGTPGSPGSPGTPGSIWFTGAGIPDNSLGVNNDLYLRSNGDVYRKELGSWALKANIKGNPGEPGSAGSQGMPGPAGGGYANILRTEVSVSTSNLVTNGSEELNVPLNRSFQLLRIITSKAARIRLYSKVSYRTADLSRPLGTAVNPGSENGLITEIVTTPGNLIFDLSPAAFGSNLESVPSDLIPIIVQNLDASSSPIDVTFEFLGLEGQSATGIRNEVEYVSGLLNQNQNESSVIEIDKAFVMYRISTDRPARVRLYTKSSYRDADLLRPIGTDISGESGLIAEVVTTLSSLSIDFSPLALGADLKSIPDGLIAISIMNLDSVASGVTITIDKLKLEG